MQTYVVLIADILNLRGQIQENQRLRLTTRCSPLKVYLRAFDTADKSERIERAVLKGPTLRLPKGRARKWREDDITLTVVDRVYTSQRV